MSETAKNAVKDEIKLTQGSGNVFADLGFDNAEALGLKARLTHLLSRSIRQRGWTQQQAADILGIKQPDVSELVRGQRLEHYSAERLLQFLARLDNRVTITVSGDALPAQEIVVSASSSAKKTRV